MQASSCGRAALVAATPGSFPRAASTGVKPREEALYRELHEEVGLAPEAVNVVAATRGWLRYRLPRRFVRKDQNPLCIGQKQKWFLLHLRAADDAVCLNANQKPEFDHWQWVSYWYPLNQVVAFKREVYRRALKELAPPLARLTDVPG